MVDPSPATPCFNGADPHMPPGVCEAPLSSTSSQSSKTKSGTKKKGKRGGEASGGERDEDGRYWGLWMICLLGMLVAAPRAGRWGKQKWEDFQIKRQHAQALQAVQRRPSSPAAAAAAAAGSRQQTQQAAFHGKGDYAR